jgi:hypothetical protein
VDIPWSELVDELAEILLDDALDRAADKDIRVNRAALQTAARTRASKLVDTEDSGCDSSSLPQVFKDRG